MVKKISKYKVNNDISVCILMATYNGEKYIEEQLNSIVNQTFENWKLYIHDDGSTDNTCDIVKRYQKETKNKIEIIENNINFKSAKKNFMFLIDYIKNKNFDYILFSDQDDIWKNDKVEKLLNEAIKSNNDVPLLVHSDAEIVNSNGTAKLKESFNKSSNIHKDRNDFYSIVLWNAVQGSSMLINKKMLEFAEVDSNEIIMHDWWFGIIASVFGNIKYINEGLLLYRQHENNVVGARKAKKISQVAGNKKFSEYGKKRKEKYKSVYNQLLQLDRYYEKMSEKHKKEYTVLKEIFKKSKFSRILFCLRKKLIFKKGLKACAGFVLFGEL